MGPDLVECLMFTASMSRAEMNEAYDRLKATATSKDPNLKEVKLCYVTVCPYLATICFDSFYIKSGDLAAREGGKEQQIQDCDTDHGRCQETR